MTSSKPCSIGRILLIESITGGGLPRGNFASSLWREAAAMREALAADLRELVGTDLVEVLTPQHGEPTPDTAVEGWPPWSRWMELLQGADALLPVAPESAGELLSLTVLAGVAGVRTLGSRPDAVWLAGSKLRTATALARAGIPVVETRRFGQDAWMPSRTGWVLKPDDGAGAEGATWLQEPLSAAICRPGCEPGEGSPGGGSAPGPAWVVQPFIEGACGSLFVHGRQGRVVLLATSTQSVRWLDNRARLTGLEVNEPLVSWAFARDLASAVSTALPGLHGFWGVDFVCGREGPLVLEVNPRPTSTYPALSRSLGWNPAGLLLGHEVPAIAGAPGRPIRLTFG